MPGAGHSHWHVKFRWNDLFTNFPINAAFFTEGITPTGEGF